MDVSKYTATCWALHKCVDTLFGYQFWGKSTKMHLILATAIVNR